MKTYVKILSIALASIIMISGSGTVFANTNDSKNNATNTGNNLLKENLRESILAEYEPLDEYQKQFRDDPEGASDMIDKIVDFKMKQMNRIDTRSGQGTISLIYYPEFKQKYYYYCGPASVLTAIYGMNAESQVSGTSYNDKQTTLARAMNTDNDKFTYVYRVTNELNKYSSELYEYHHEPTKSQMHHIIDGSLLSDNAPILHAETQYLNYYNGYSTGHYITVVYYNMAMDDNEKGGLAVMDNNRDDKYYGTQEISMNEAYAATRDRFLIGVDF